MRLTSLLRSLPSLVDNNISRLPPPPSVVLCATSQAPATYANFLRSPSRPLPLPLLVARQPLSTQPSSPARSLSQCTILANFTRPLACGRTVSSASCTRPGRCASLGCISSRHRRCDHGGASGSRVDALLRSIPSTDHGDVSALDRPPFNSPHATVRIDPPSSALTRPSTRKRLGVSASA